MTLTWLPGAQVHDLHPGIGNGPFGAPGRAFLGVILHVNVDEHGTPDSFWGDGNPNQVCPNFQVYKDGSIHQMLPLDWQPWCQIDGNFNYAAIETAGLPNEPLTDAQLASCATIVRAYATEMHMQLRLANKPGEPGLGTHQMGGAAWGGHPCPGTIRANQRKQIIALALGNEEDMPLNDADLTKVENLIASALTAALSGHDSGAFNAKDHPGLLKAARAAVAANDPKTVVAELQKIRPGSGVSADDLAAALEAAAKELG